MTEESITVTADECMPGIISGRMKTADPATSNTPKVGREKKRGQISIRIVDNLPGNQKRHVTYRQTLSGMTKVDIARPYSFEISLGFTTVVSKKRYGNEIAAKRAADRFVELMLRFVQSSQDTN